MCDIEGAALAPLLLIAQDGEWASRALASIFEASGFTVLQTACGRDAAELARAREPDAVIVGDHLPNVNGVELCRRLKAEPRLHPWTPLVLVTVGSFGRAERLEAYHAGAWDVLSQPVDVELLLLKMRAFLGARRQGRCRTRDACSTRRAASMALAASCSRRREIIPDVPPGLARGALGLRVSPTQRTFDVIQGAGPQARQRKQAPWRRRLAIWLWKRTHE